MQDLTIEQKKFARKIGAVYCRLINNGSEIDYYRDIDIGLNRYSYWCNSSSGWCIGTEKPIGWSNGRVFEIDFTPLDELSKVNDKEQPAKGWDESIRGQQMSGTGGNRIWKYQMPVAEEFTMQLPVGAQIIRMDGENGYLWLWAVVDSDAPTEDRHFAAYKAGGTMPDDLSNHTFAGTAHIYIQQELMLYLFEVAK